MKSSVTKCVLSALAVFQSFIAHAEADSYRFNLSGLGSVQNDSKDTETRSPALGLQVFFKPVINDPQQAFDQHEFIQRASNLYLTVIPTEVNTSTLKTQLSNTNAALTYYLGDMFAKLAYSKGSGDIKLKSTSTRLYDLESDASTYAAGYYLYPNSHLMVSVDKTSISLSANSTDDVTTKTGLTSKTLWNVGEQQSLCLELSLSEISHQYSTTYHNHEANLSLKYYPVPAAYIQLNVTRNQGESKYNTGLNNSAAAGSSAMLAAGYAFTPRLSVYAAYLNFTATGSSTDSHTTLLAGNYRF